MAIPAAPGQARRHPRHPLAEALIGAWVFDTAGWAVDRVYGQDLAVGSAGTTRIVTAAGAAYAGPVTIVPTPQIVPTDRLRRAGPVSLFWYGVVLANTAANNPAIVSHYHNTLNSPPYISYGLHRPNSTDLWLAYNNAGTFGNLTAVGVFAAAEYPRPIALGATFGPSSVRGYKQGREIISGAGISGITYHSTSRIACNYNVSSGELAGTATALVYVFATALTPTDHALLAVDPYGLLTTGRAGMRIAAPAAAVERVQSFVWMPV